MSTFAQRLRQLRGERSQREMAMLLNVEQASYAYYELGKRQPKLNDFTRICRVLNVSADWILGINDTQPQADPSVGERLALLRAQSERTKADMERIDRELAELAEKARR